MAVTEEFSGHEAAVREVRAFNRAYTRRIGLLDYPEAMRSPYSLGEARVLYELAQYERTNVQWIREELGLTAAYLSRMLGRFEEQGLITRERHPQDARHTQVALTPAGREAAARLGERSREAIAALLRRLNPTQVRGLTQALRTVRSALTDPYPSETRRLREPEPGDLGWIVRLNAQVYAAEYGWNAEYEGLVARIVADYAEDHDPERERVWIAELDGVPVGSVMCVRDAARATARLRLLIVDPAARGRGIGDELVAACVRFAREVGYKELVLWTNDVLSAARKIYQRAGFTLVAEKPHHSYGKELNGQDWRLAL